MTIEIYRQLTTRTLPDLGGILYGTEITIPSEIRENISNKLNFTHMALGLAGEIGELIQCIGTELRTTVDKKNLKEELGDIYWYLANYANMRDLDIPEEPQVDITEVECLDFLITSICDLVDIVKRFMAYNKAIDRVKEAETIYNIRVALLMMEKTYELNGADIRAANIAKLTARYPDKFSEHLAVNRDLEKEKKALEG